MVWIMDFPTEWLPQDETPDCPGIYLIHCHETGLSYVGMSTASVRIRVHRHHLTALRRGNHDNTHLQRVWSKRGEAAFGCAVLEAMPGATKAEVAAREIHWIATLDTTDPTKGFNRSTGGEATAKGHKFTPEQRQRISEAHKGIKIRDRGPEWREKLRQANLGKKKSEESKEKARIAMTGKKMSEEAKANMRAAQAKIAARGPKPPKSAETRAKISKASSRPRKPLSEEHKAKLRAARIGKHLSDETKAKMSATTKGVAKSKETRARMKVASQLREDKKRESAVKNSSGPEGPES